MKKKVLFYVIFVAMIITLDVVLIANIRERSKLCVAFDTQASMKLLRNQQVSLDVVEQLLDHNKNTDDTLGTLLFTYLYTGLENTDELTKYTKVLTEQYPDDTRQMSQYMEAIWDDLKYFPVPISSDNEDATVAFEDSWMQSRAYGGERGHEGCDIMAHINTRGYYPIVSVSDGVIEKVGWLSQGGYRIGVRSIHGAYFYYAHLYDYAKDFSIGDTVAAGDLLGFMGDSGYSDVEGTVGNFDVHLHFGIYLNDANNKEFSVNSYWILRYLEDKKLTYAY